MKSITDVYIKVLSECGYDMHQENIFIKGVQQITIHTNTSDQELAESIASGMPGTLQDNIMEVFFRIKTFRQRLTS